MKIRFPSLTIAGAQSSAYRSLSDDERAAVIQQIRDSGARILFAGLGCPKQEVFTYEMSQRLSMPILAVGAAFDYHAGLLREPPDFIQKYGLQWLYRMIQEPRRLWRRYLITNTQFVGLLGMQFSRLWRPDPENAKRPEFEWRYG
jgi:N-acetylglucosaminyldiphosphoundecaprenol N-acetyl-beta-D-mannosaminyltransferase